MLEEFGEKENRQREIDDAHLLVTFGCVRVGPAGAALVVVVGLAVVVPPLIPMQT